jgi:hypothetical protein
MYGPWQFVSTVFRGRLWRSVAVDRRIDEPGLGHTHEIVDAHSYVHAPSSRAHDKRRERLGGLLHGDLKAAIQHGQGRHAARLEPSQFRAFWMGRRAQPLGSQGLGQLLQVERPQPRDDHQQRLAMRREDD